MRRIGILLYCCLSVLSSRAAASVAVPNYSFENPPTAFVDTNIVDWQKSPTPYWYDETANGPWAQLTGVFANTDTNSSDHIYNCDGNQGAFLFALPGVALFQDQTAATNSSFTATYDVGKAYDLTVGVIGKGGGMSNGVTLQLWLYYRDASNNMVPIAATTVTNSDSQFPDRNHFIDFTAHLRTVQPSDPWAGKNIGVEIISTVDFSLAGGYWDLDNVRLISSQKPSISQPAFSNSQFTFTVNSEPGAHLKIIATAPLVTVLSGNWTTIADFTNTTGTVSMTNSTAGYPYRFFEIQVP